MKGLGGLMQQAQKIQEEMAKTQEEIKHLECTGQAGGGLVTVVMNGKHQLKNLQLDDSLFSDDKDMLEDLLTAAINDAVNKVDQAIKDKYASITGGLNLPGGMQMPF